MFFFVNYCCIGIFWFILFIKGKYIISRKIEYYSEGIESNMEKKIKWEFKNG